MKHFNCFKVYTLKKKKKTLLIFNLTHYFITFL